MPWRSLFQELPVDVVNLLVATELRSVLVSGKMLVTWIRDSEQREFRERKTLRLKPGALWAAVTAKNTRVSNGID